MEKIKLRLVGAIEVFDIDLIKEILHKSFESNELDNNFINKLYISFNEFKEFGDTKLISSAGKCGSCDKRKGGYLFVGNNSNNYMSFIISKNKRGIEIFKCSYFNCFERNINLKSNMFDMENPF
ncbi:hypothetical protein [Flavobacterium sp.]|uniref:hypothetical protein n=1 Tax=Flavobacterium sp. TaxID=239 RepID=UPI003D28483F